MHSRIGPSWLSGSRPKRTEGSDYRCGMTADQVAARELGKSTPLPSIELTVDPGFLVGNCENGYSCVYTSSLCWRDATTPLPMEADPRAVFERLFGEADTPGSAVRDLRDDRSILDAVAQDMSVSEQAGKRGSRACSASISKRCAVSSAASALTEQHNSRSPVQADKPLSIPDSYEEHVRLMFDLLASCVPERRDARAHVPVRARAEPSKLSVDRRPGCAPRRLASRRQPDSALRATRGSTCTTWRSSPSSSRRCGRRRTATGRCSIIRSSFTAPA